MRKFIVDTVHYFIVGVIITLITFMFMKLTNASDTYQEVNPEFKLLNIQTNLEVYTSGEEKLYKLESPHGHWFNPQGFGHTEQITLDLRRFKVDLGIIDYIPVFLGVKYRTFAYIPYADSVQLVGQELGLKVPVLCNSLWLEALIRPQSWSGSQVTSIDYSLIGQFIDNKSKYYLLNFNIDYHQNTFLSLMRFIENDNVSWTSSKALLFDFTFDTRAINNYVYFSYRLDYKWNDDPTQEPTQYKYIKHALVLGNSSEISKDINLIYEGSFEWRNNIRVARVNLILNFATNLE